MGFLNGLRGKSSFIASNVQPRLYFVTTHRFLGSMAGGSISLEDVKQSGTMGQKKQCMRKILQQMASNMRDGILGGCMEPTKIPIIGSIPELPYEAYVKGKHPSYLSSVGNLAIYLHEHDQMSVRNKMKYEDFKKYTGLLGNMRHLVLLAGHPHLQTRYKEREYIPQALHQLNSIPSIDNHFPPLHPNSTCHQVPLELASSYPQEYQKTWEDTYRAECIKRNINIKASIKGAGKAFRNNYYYKQSVDKPNQYKDNDAVDELFFYSNMMKHYVESGNDKIINILHERFPFNTIEMFMFHWTYDGHARGIVDLEQLM